MKRLYSAALILPLLAAQGFWGEQISPRLLTFHGKSDYVIVKPDACSFEVTGAAANLKRAVKKATGADIPVASETSLPSAGAQKRKYIRIGFDEQTDGICETLLYRDFAVYSYRDDVWIAAGSDEVYSQAVDYIAGQYLSGGEWMVPSYPYVYRDKYPAAGLTLYGKPLPDYTVVYETEAAKALAEDFSERVLQLCGAAPAVSETPGDYTLTFGSGTGLFREEYRISGEKGKVTVSSPTSMGLTEAYRVFCQRMFEESGNNGDMNQMDFSGRLEQPSAYQEEIIYREPLSNTLKKLTGDKTLRVAYFGGSVTVGYGASDREKNSWRARTTAWLRENFPDAEITEINAAIGASGTHLGAFRTQRDIVSQQPDLLFIEFAANDSYNGENADSAAENLEAILRQVRRAYPTCDIVAVYITDASKTAAGGNYLQKTAHDGMAARYGISSVDVGKALARTKQLKGSASPEWKNYFTDSVHMTDAGYEEYAKAVTEFLTNELIFGTVPDVITEHPLPDAVKDGADRTLYFDLASEEHLSGMVGYTFNSGSFQNLPLTPYNGYLTTSDKDNLLTYTFTGTELSLFLSSFTAGSVQYTLDDGQTWKTVTRNSMNQPFVLVRNLTYGTHTVKLRVVFTDKNNTTVGIGAFLYR